MIFEEIKLDWGGKEYTIAPEHVLKCIAKVEDVVSINEVAEMLLSGKLKFAKIAAAYATFLRYAGARVTDEEVFLAIFPKGADGGASMISMVMSRLEVLMKMMSPPQSLLGKPDEKKVEATRH